MTTGDRVIPVTEEAGDSLLARLLLTARRLLTSELVLVSFALALLVVLFFYDVVFLDRTLLTSGRGLGVMGNPMPWGYPGERPDHNPYLLDPLVSTLAESTVQRTSESYRDFSLPLWDSSGALGKPQLASAGFSLPSPNRLPVLIWPTQAAWDAVLLARFFVAGLFTFLFLRRLGMAAVPSFGAAVAYSFSGFFMLYANMTHPDLAMLIPMLLYAFELLLQRPAAWHKLFAAGVITLSILMGNPERTFVALVFGTGYYLARVVTMVIKERGTAPLRSLLPLAIVVTTGIGLAAFVLVPFVELAGVLQIDGAGVHRHGPERSIGLRYIPLNTLIAWFVPYFNGPPQANFQDGGWSGIRNYVGVVVPLVAAIGLWNRPLMARAGWFFAAATVLIIAKLHGVPIINWIGALPFFNVTDIGLYFAPAAGFSIAFLAGMGLDHIIAGRARVWQGLLSLAALAGLLAWVIWLNRGLLDAIPERHLTVQVGFAAVLVMAGGALILVTRRGLIPLSVGSLLLVALIAGELFAFTIPTKGQFAFAGEILYGDRVPYVTRPLRHDPFTKPPYVEFLQNDTSKYRVFGLQRLLYPNTSGVYDIDDIRSFSAISVERYIRYIQTFISPDAGARFSGDVVPSLGTERQPVRYAANPMFDLLDVKYILTYHGLIEAFDTSLADAFITSNGRDRNRLLRVLSVGGQDALALYLTRPLSLQHEITPDEQIRYLLFQLALDPKVWDPAKGDGVLFEVTARQDGREELLYSRWVDPKNDPEDRRWVHGAVDLAPYLGQTVTLVLSTSPGDGDAWDWAGWGALRLAPSPDTPPVSHADQFRLVYDGEASVYENLHAFPRAFLVRRAVPASGLEHALTLMQDPDFHPAVQAVIEGDLPPEQAAALAAGPATDSSSVEITSYGDTEVELQVRAENPGLLVLSDTYYPGWKAYVDGQRTPIYPTDAALRSVFVPAGQHEVKFVYDPASFRLGTAITLASLGALALYAASGPASRYGRRWLRRRSGDL